MVPADAEAPHRVTMTAPGLRASSFLTTLSRTRSVRFDAALCVTHCSSQLFYTGCILACHTPAMIMVSLSQRWPHIWPPVFWLGLSCESFPR